MKKVYILTLFGANNIGAFLQAYATKKLIEREGFHALFVSFGGAQGSRTKAIMKYLKKLEFRKLFFKFNSSKRYSESQKIFERININDITEDGIYLVGSDEIWNLGSKSFAHQKEYFGIGLENKELFSFASSANNCSLELFKNQDYVIDFSNFKSLCVRDDKTFEIVKELSNRSSLIVNDPTLIYDALKNDKVGCCKEKEFIMIYSYGFTKLQIRSIKEFAKKKGLKTISVGTYNAWCNKNVVVTPFEFLDYLDKAKYVITSTFHGCVLSINFNKQFFVFANESEKIKSVINKFLIKDHSDISGASIAESFEKPFNYDLINAIINEDRIKALDYLKSNLN